MARRLWGPGFLWICRAKLKVFGLQGIDFVQPQIIVMNHQSYVDIPVAFAALPADLHFIAKKELGYIPFLGWYIWALGMIFVDRSSPRKSMQSLKRAGELVRNGKTVLAFPEGTRKPGGAIGAFKRGAFYVALEAKVPILPVYVAGAGQVLPPGSALPRPGLVRVFVGHPVSTLEYKTSDLDLLIEKVRTQLTLLESQALATS